MNKLEEMRQKLESKKVMVENMSMRSRIAKEDACKKKERLGVEVESLLVAGTALSVSRKRLQVILHFILVSSEFSLFNMSTVKNSYN